ncbi:hypothetical protein HMPREF1985_01676 [Mitsuokella sp. oral taxon 131 str. W9106]|nr:hypothetical protein HMPREF1985_01676 [Mitsuokella sp. oral taxon 131 str. W9106]
MQSKERISAFGGDALFCCIVMGVPFVSLSLTGCAMGKAGCRLNRSSFALWFALRISTKIRYHCIMIA